jgi:hypothetical protein
VKDTHERPARWVGRFLFRGPDRARKVRVGRTHAWVPWVGAWADPRGGEEGQGSPQSRRDGRGRHGVKREGPEGREEESKGDRRGRGDRRGGTPKEMRCGDPVARHAAPRGNLPAPHEWGIRPRERLPHLGGNLPDPRERGVAPCGRVVAPRERGVDPCARVVDPCERRVDPCARAIAPRERRVDPRERGLRPPFRVAGSFLRSFRPCEHHPRAGERGHAPDRKVTGPKKGLTEKRNCRYATPGHAGRVPRGGAGAGLGEVG